jgi:hypothetical protein
LTSKLARDQAQAVDVCHLIQSRRGNRFPFTDTQFYQAAFCEAAGTYCGIYADFPEFNYHGRVLTEKYYIESEQRANLLRNGTAIERYNLLLQMHPDIVQRVPLWMIASHINVSHEALSRVRSQHRQ